MSRRGLLDRGGGSGKGESNSNPPPVREDPEVIWSKQLYEALLKAGHFTGRKRPSHVRWPTHFTALLDHREAKRVKEVLDWYCQNLETPYVPVCDCARTFCEKFKRLEMAMERQSLKQEEDEDTGW